MAEASLFPLATESSPGRRLPHSSASRPDPDTGDIGQDLRRRQSVRFMGSCSAHGRDRGTQAGDNARDLDFDTTNTIGGNPQSEEDSALQHPSPPRRAPPPVPLQKVATSYLHALSAEDEYYTPEDDVASAPSSYRRLHRSKSMFTKPESTRKSHESSRQSLASSSIRSRPLAASTSRRLFRSDPHDHGFAPKSPTLRAPKSMSFLRSRKSQSRSLASRDGGLRHSGLPGLPEDGSSDTEERTPRPRHKASAFFGSLGHRSDLRMRKSLRGSGSADGSNADSREYAEEPRTLRFKARQASKSLRGKLKNFFAVTKPEEETPTIPCQHREAQRTHVTELSPSTSGCEVPSIKDDAFIHSPLARRATLRLVSPELHSRKASLESLRGERDRHVSDGSSLTSWAHSGPSTLTSQEQQQWREWEKQRLSVIGENGAHAPSPSIRRRGLGSGVFLPPRSTLENSVPVRPVVDSQRIYSAPVKRMQTVDSDAAQGGEKQSDPVKSAHVILASEDDDRSQTRTPETIKRVHPERRYSRESNFVTTPTRASRRTSHSRNSWDDQLAKRPAVTPKSRHVYQSILSDVLHQGRPASVTTNAANSHKEADWPPRATDGPVPHLFRTESPFRRAFRRSMQEEQDAWAQQSSTTEQCSETGTQIHHATQLTETDSDSAKDLEYSESVYSSDDEEHTPVGSRNRTTALDTPAMYHREASTASSVDWKTWLSANICKLEPSPSPSKPSETEPDFTPPTMVQSHFSSLCGHVREQAQTHSDRSSSASLSSSPDDVFNPPPYQTQTATTITRQKRLAPPPPTTAPPPPPQPLGQLKPNIPSPSPLRRSLKRITPAPPTSLLLPADKDKEKEKENESPGTLCLGQTPPPIPPRSKLRPAPLRISRGAVPVGMVSPAAAGTMSVVSSPGLTEAVMRQFGGGGPDGFGRGGGGGYGVGIGEVLASGNWGPEGERGKGLEKGGEVGNESIAFI